MMIELFIIVLLLLSFGIFFVPKKFQYYLMLFLQLGLIAFSTNFAIQEFYSNAPLQFNIDLINGMAVNFVIDMLSAFFMLVINITFFTGTLYANGYLASSQSEKTKTEMAFHYFNMLLLYVSLTAVVMLREGIGFLVSWELMSVSIFFLIMYESSKKENQVAGIKFLFQMHIALLFLIVAFLISSFYTGQSLGFDNLALYFQNNSAFPLFILFFIGFGIKAGFIPLHTWLPHAHPAAPSHVSGIMSGVVIKMGIYGILRVLTYIHNDLLTIGIFILIISIISGIGGVLLAIVQHNYKRLLAYHSIENIGIIGIGIGLGVIGLAIGNNKLAALGFAGGMLHILNHSLFKSLLFYSAGSVYQQTHTLNIEFLGGIMKKMPFTAISFLVGAIAISGLPPFNGFISEFLIYSGLITSLSSYDLMFSFLILGAIISLVVIGGLAVFCFTKIFSIMFLGHPRSDFSASAREVRGDMLSAKFVVIFLILAIGLLPFLIIEPMAKVTSIFVNDTSVLQNMTSVLTNVSISFGVFLLLIAVIWFIRYRITKKQTQEIQGTWGCGYTGANVALHQYTATSYADYIIEKSHRIVGVKKHFISLKNEDLFPRATSFKSENSDLIEDYLILKPIRKLFKYMEKIAIFQTGYIEHYLLYAISFVLIISILSILNLI